jgi:hypothetical protein
MIRLLSYLRIATAILVVAVLLPFLYIGRKLWGEPPEGVEYERF